MRGSKVNRKTNAALARIAKRKRLSTEAHLRMPIAEWRAKKRTEWKHLMAALSLFTYGSAYTPAGNDLFEIQKAADRISESMKDEWVCW